jgi:hypothetical protein
MFNHDNALEATRRLGQFEPKEPIARYLHSPSAHTLMRREARCVTARPIRTDARTLWRSVSTSLNGQHFNTLAPATLLTDEPCRHEEPENPAASIRAEGSPATHRSSFGTFFQWMELFVVAAVVISITGLALVVGIGNLPKTTSVTQNPGQMLLLVNN